MRIPIMNVDQVGVIADVNPHDLPLNAWSGGKNVRFHEGKAEKIKGYENLITPTVAPYFLLPVDAPGGYFWIYAGSQKAYVVQEQTHTELTRASGDYGTTPGNNWTGGLLNGLAVLNNGVDKPQAWTSPNVLTKLVDLPNWPATWVAKSLRPFKYYLVALGISEGGVLNPHRLAWSHVTDPGSLPSSWNIADPTKDAGDYILADTEGALIDQCTLGDFNMLYKTDAAYLMRHIGGVDIMAFKRVSNSDGILGKNCACELSSKSGPKNLVFGPSDIYLTNGQGVEPILRSRMRNWLYRVIDSENAKNSFVVHNSDTKEVYVCFPESGQAYPSLALVWNYLHDTTTVKDLPRVSCAALGKAVPDFKEIGTDSWANATGTWADDTGSWGGSEYSPITNRLLMGSALNTKVYLQDNTSSFAGTAVKSTLERIGLNVLGKDPSGKPIFDTDSMKTVTEVWPRINAPKGMVFNIYVGKQDSQHDPVEWKGPYPLTIGQKKKVNPYITGRIISVRFEVTTKEHWSMSGYDLEIIPGGRN